MTTITFDTLQFVRRLKDAGIPEPHAEAISEAFKEAQVTQASELAAKRDLKELEGQLSTKADMAKIEARIRELELKVEVAKVELRKEIESAKVETIKWVVATGIVILGGVAALNRMVPPPVPVYFQPPAQEMRLPSPVQPAPVLPK
ncbi:MAG: DUF1640 domain-containing protein [Magnetococcales bacterium]|nr:DUF1640 domain-containing protein [Magnetococcales bacterium]